MRRGVPAPPKPAPRPPIFPPSPVPSKTTLTRDAVNAFYADGPGADGVTMSEADVVKTAPADAAAAAEAAEKKKDDGPRESSFLEKLFAVIAVPFKILFALIMWLPSKLFRSSSD